MNSSRATEQLRIPTFRHATEVAYAHFVQKYTTNERRRQQLLLAYRRFVQCYPDLQAWTQLPLTERVGRLYGESTDHPSFPVSYEARPYLFFLTLQGSFQFDWNWLLAVHHVVNLTGFLNCMELDLGVTKLLEDARQLGYEQRSVGHLQWCIYRFFLHAGPFRIENMTDAHLDEMREAIHRFGEQPDIHLFFESAEHYRLSIEKERIRFLFRLQVVLYHRGQVSTLPRIQKQRLTKHWTTQPRMLAVLERYLATRRLTDEPGTVKRYNTNIRQFTTWLEQTYPTIESFAQVSRDHILEYAEFLATTPTAVTGQPLAKSSRRQVLSGLSVFFQNVVRWEWDDVPKRPLLQSGDLPKMPQRIPRYIPEHELDQLMPAIRALECPYQRAALLIARWSGARREEIQRLPVDCLDSYPDGTARLHIPAGKTKRERLVPLNREAADAIRVLQAHRKGERGLPDRQTGIITRYLFLRRGKLLSCEYLFEMALETACAVTGLITAEGKPNVTAHRFRHTVGTQLARRGARLRTIQKILGHESAQMSVVYIGITDEDVRNDYQAVLGSDANIAGPGAELIRSGNLAPSEIRWIQEHYFQTELELGRCLRLPQEGPCECDLYLTCAKFVTSPEYAPRLRRRRRIEQELVEDATTHGWQREVERHQCTIRRLEQLLTDLGEPIEGLEATD
jgi:site-specific recombinase XerD